MIEAEQFPLPMTVPTVTPNLLDAYRKRRDALAEHLRKEADKWEKEAIDAAMRGEVDRFRDFFKTVEIQCSECGHIKDFDWCSKEAETFYDLCLTVCSMEDMQQKRAVTE